VTVGIAEAPRTLDPQQVSDIQNDLAATSAYDALVTYKDGKLQPELATSWTYAPDGKSLDLTLRSGVQFHSGNPVTAGDVVYTLNRIKTLNTGIASYIPDFAGADAVGDDQVRITLSSANLQFIGALSKVYILDSALVQQNLGTDNGQAWLASNDAGSGPYTVESYSANDQMTLEKSDTYWEPTDGRPDSLVFRYIEKSGTRASELRSGGIDLTARLVPTDVKQFDDGSYHVTSLPTLNQTMVMMNSSGGLLADDRVREAVTLAYDYKAHLDTILAGEGTPATGLVAPAVSCRVEIPAGQQNIARAKELVDEAGAAGKSLTIVYQPVFQEHTDAATLLQSDLKEIGLDLTLKPVTFPEYLQLISSPTTQPDLGLIYDNPNYPEIGDWLTQRFDSASIGRNNFARYSNPAVDQLLAAGAAATDTNTACDQYRQAQQLIVDDDVAMNIANPDTTVVSDERVAPVANDPAFVIFNPKLIRLADAQ
jgi:peptide/nickel transport system substrate-binding protein